ncbi:hypothetical protein GT030_01205 [Streptomyces sp. SID1328]|uniref:hypothetical protein n=1 Tax=Streptomyces sp. SID1328 TaxID=2690250 RepID=UPI00136B2D25|nr:hypothetical protein [Streptomyces sp. SID1328]MYV37521.1 hypothetical protein [Streptomyces sp. SID1328]
MGELPAGLASSDTGLENDQDDEATPAHPAGLAEDTWASVFPALLAATAVPDPGLREV